MGSEMGSACHQLLVGHGDLAARREADADRGACASVARADRVKVGGLTVTRMRSPHRVTRQGIALESGFAGAGFVIGEAGR